MRDTEAPLSGRRREAARNDIGILDAARSVFLEDPAAPVSAVAARAKVGISALYRRYPSKEDLLRELARDGLTRYAAELEAALADDRDPWLVYADCLARILDGGSQALAQRLAGTFTPTPELSALAQRASALAEQVHRTAQRHQVLRDDVEPVDVVFLLEMLSTVILPGADGGHALRHRYLALLLQSLRAPGSGPLPSGPDPAELTGRWSGRRKDAGTRLRRVTPAPEMPPPARNAEAAMKEEPSLARNATAAEVRRLTPRLGKPHSIYYPQCCKKL